MAKITIGDTTYTVKYFVTIRKGDRELYYWRPQPYYQYGFEDKRLSDDKLKAVLQAQECNEGLERSRRRKFRDTTGGYEPGSFSHAIELYLASRRWNDLSPNTKPNYMGRIKKLRKNFGHTRIASWDREKINELYETALGPADARTPRKAHDIIKVMSNIIDAARNAGIYQRNGIIMENPCRRLGMVHNPPRQVIWQPEEVTWFIDNALRLGDMKMALAVCIAANTSQRVTDIRAMLKSDYRDGRLHIIQSKTGEELWIPCPARLREMLDDWIPRAPEECPTIISCYNPRQRKHKPYSKGAFDKRFALLRTDFWLDENLQFRDLRATMASELIDAGCTDYEYASITGHSLDKSKKIIETYWRTKNKHADAAIIKIEDARKARNG
jgi:integrase